ncbi:excalibur calcium-binding protein [Streptomyces sp. NPDC094143]|uniref:excalibur calcium-binding protein n=1 Tax=Streptomyces sp. NPDC094143 TaxID=3155310 RepID=UPI0033231829
MRRRTGVIGTLFAVAAIVPLSAPAHARSDRDCGDFAFQEDVQAVFDADRSDPHRLDEDRGPGRRHRVRGAAAPGHGRRLPHGFRPAVRVRDRHAGHEHALRHGARRDQAGHHPSQGVRGGTGGAVAAGPSDRDVGLGPTFAASAAFMAGHLVRRRRRR